MTTLGGAQSGGFQHFREQAAWFIDPVSGDDINPGAVMGQPIKTHAELERRWGPRAFLPQATTVRYLDSADGSDPVNIDVLMDGNNTLHYTGTASTVASGSLTSVPVNLVTDTSYTEIMDDVADPFVGLEQGRFRRTSDGALAWIWRVESAEEAWMGPVATSDVSGNPVASDGAVTLVNLANTDAYVIETLSELPLSSVRVENVTPAGGVLPRASVTFEDFTIGNVTNGNLRVSSIGTNAMFKGCAFLQCQLQKPSNLQLISCGLMGLLANGGNIVTRACTIMDPFGLGSGLAVFGGIVILDDETLAGESSIIREGFPIVTVQGTAQTLVFVGSGNCSVANKDSSFTGIRVDPTTQLVLGGLLWGILDGGGALLNNQGRVFLESSGITPPGGGTAAASENAFPIRGTNFGTVQSW